MAQAADYCNHPGRQTAFYRRAATSDCPTIGGRFGKAHRYSRTKRGGKVDQKRCFAALGGKSGGKNTRQGGNRPIYQTGQRRLYTSEDKLTSGRHVFAACMRAGQMRVLKRQRGGVMRRFAVR